MSRYTQQQQQQQRVSSSVDDGKADTPSHHQHVHKQQQHGGNKSTQFLKLPPEAIINDHIISGQSLNIPSKHITNQSHDAHRREVDLTTKWSDERSAVDRAYVSDIKQQLDTIWAAERHPYKSWPFKKLLSSELFRHVFKNGLLQDARLVDVKSPEISHILNNIKNGEPDAPSTVVVDDRYEFRALPNQPVLSYTKAAQRYKEHHHSAESHHDDRSSNGAHRAVEEKLSSPKNNNTNYKHYDANRLNVSGRGSQIDEMYTHYKARDERERINAVQREYSAQNQTKWDENERQQYEKRNDDTHNDGGDDRTDAVPQVFTIKPQELVWNKQHHISEEQLEQQRKVVESIIQQHDLLHHLRIYNNDIISKLSSRNPQQPEKYKYVHPVPHHKPVPTPPQDLTHIIQLLDANKTRFEEIMQLKRDKSGYDHHLSNAARTFFSNQFIIHELLHDIRSNERALHNLFPNEYGDDKDDKSSNGARRAADQQLMRVIDSSFPDIMQKVPNDPDSVKTTTLPPQQQQQQQQQQHSSENNKIDENAHNIRRASTSSSLREHTDAPPFKPPTLFAHNDGVGTVANRNQSQYYRRLSAGDMSTSLDSHQQSHNYQQQPQQQQPQQADSAVMLISVAEYNRLLGLSHNDSAASDQPLKTTTVAATATKGENKNYTTTQAHVATGSSVGTGAGAKFLSNAGSVTSASIKTPQPHHASLHVAQLQRPGSASSTMSTSSRGADGLTRKERRKVFWLKYLDQHPEEAKNNPLAKKHQMYATNKHHNNISHHDDDNHATSTGTAHGGISAAGSIPATKRRSSISHYIQTDSNLVRTINLDPIALIGEQKDPLEFEFTVL